MKTCNYYWPLPVDKGPNKEVLIQSQATELSLFLLGVLRPSFILLCVLISYQYKPPTYIRAQIHAGEM